MQQLTVLMRQTRQAVCAIYQSVLFRCLCFSYNTVFMAPSIINDNSKTCCSIWTSQERQVWSGKPYWMERLSTVDLLVNAACFVQKETKNSVLKAAGLSQLLKWCQLYKLSPSVRIHWFGLVVSLVYTLPLQPFTSICLTNAWAVGIGYNIALYLDNMFRCVLLF